ncbi:MAG: Mur ligase family protein [Syntrophothermus sp.]
MNQNPGKSRRLLNDLLAGLVIQAVYHPAECEVTGVVADSRMVEPGSIFVAINGNKQDGHDFIREAVARGAAGVVVEQLAAGMLEEVHIPVIKVRSGRRALAHLASAFYGFPARRMTMIGVTGTNGKTTTTFMIDAILEAAGLRSGLIGTVQVKTGAVVYPARLTTPDALDIQRYLREMADQGIQFATMEVSSQGVVQERIHGMDFQIGVFTNMTPDHLDFHGTFERYVAAKRRFVGMLPPGGIVLLNNDDPIVANSAAWARARPVTYAIDSEADIAAGDLVFHPGGAKFTVSLNKPIPALEGRVVPQSKLPLEIHLPGKHNVYNALAAAAVTLMAGVSPPVIAETLASFRCVERRMELVPTNNGPVILDDTALNPASIDSVFQVVRTLPFRRLVVVNALRGNRGTEVNRLNAVALAEWTRRLGFWLVTTTSAGDVGGEDVVTRQEEEAFLEALNERRIPFSHFEELAVALQAALADLGKEDLLVLLGAQGMDAGARIVQELLVANGEALPVPGIAYGAVGAFS